MEGNNLMKNLRLILLAGIFMVFASSVHATSYFGFGAGLQLDLNGFGATIMKDGLDSSVGQGSCYKCDPSQNFEGGRPQQIVVPENTLITLQGYTMNAIQTKTGGPMVGLALNGFYENEVTDYSFFRVGLNHTRKILGGETSATFVKIPWYHLKFDAKYWEVPLYYGFKAKVGESAAVYAGGGVHLFKGMWSLKLTNLGDIPSTMLGVSLGTNTVVNPATGQQKEGRIFGDSGKFALNGYGFNALLGVEGGKGNKAFFEIEWILSGGQSAHSVRLQTPGGATALAPFATYPVVPGGTIYRFGYKIAM